MRQITIAVVLLGFVRVHAEAGGIDYEIRSGIVHKVEADTNKVTFTVSGKCAIYLKDPDRDDKANRVETVLKRCVITITKEGFEKIDLAPERTWAEFQKSAKSLAGKTAFMQLSGTATIADNRITAIRGWCSFKQVDGGRR